MNQAKVDAFEWPSGHVLMYIPVEVAVEVEHLVADRRLRDQTNSGPASEAADDRSGSHATRVGRPGRVWSIEEWRSLVEAKTVSSERIMLVLDCLANRAPGEANKTSLDELAVKCGMTIDQIKSALGKLSLHINARRALYQDEQWPFAWAYGREVDPSNPRAFHYWFTREQHEAWFAAKR